MQMPPLELMVLDSLADDEESVETMRDHGEVAPYGLALVSEDDVIAAVGELLNDGCSGPGVPLDADWWLHRVGGAALIALSGAAIGRLPSIEDRPNA